jgi:hypothetical protein
MYIVARWPNFACDAIKLGNFAVIKNSLDPRFWKISPNPSTGGGGLVEKRHQRCGNRANGSGF